MPSKELTLTDFWLDYMDESGFLSQAVRNVRLTQKAQSNGSSHSHAIPSIWIDTMNKSTHLRAFAGIENPRVMKSPSLIFFLSRSLWKRLCRFSLRANRCLFFRSCSSSSTLAVKSAVEAFLMPDDETCDVSDEFGLTAEDAAAVSLAGDAVEISPLACFFRFFDPESFFSEWVNPCSARRWPRSISRCLSAFLVGRRTITLSSV